MMTLSERPMVTRDLGRRLVQQRFGNWRPDAYWAREVTFYDPRLRVDFMQASVRGRVVGADIADRLTFRMFEVKSSMEDFHSGHGLNFIGDLNYVVCPTELAPGICLELPEQVGVLVPGPWNGLDSYRSAKRVARLRSASEMLLMMQRSSQRDAMKWMKGGGGDADSQH